MIRQKNITIIIVHYHTPVLLTELIWSIDRHIKLPREHFEILIVNNGGRLDLTEFQTSLLAVEVLDSPENLGYSGAINAGVALSRGEILIIMNADLLVQEDSISRLVRALDHCDVVGPRFYLDRTNRVLLPPTELNSLQYRVMKVLGERSGLFSKMLHQMWWKSASRHFISSSPIPSLQLSGAMLAFYRRTYEEVGPFDERFKLYFEETDWLLRLSQMGKKAMYEPGSNIIHHFNQSAKIEDKSREWYRQSEVYFFEKHVSFAGKWILQILRFAVRNRKVFQGHRCWKRIKSPGDEDFLPLHVTANVALRDQVVFMQMSVFPTFVPSAVQILEDMESMHSWTIDLATWSKMQEGAYYFRIVDLKGRQILPSP